MIKLKKYLALLLILFSVFSFAQLPKPTLVGTPQKYSAKGMGTTGIPNISYTLPAGKNRMIMVSTLVERDRSNTNPNLLHIDGLATSFPYPYINGTRTISVSISYNATSIADQLSWGAVTCLLIPDNLSGNVIIDFPQMTIPNSPNDELSVIVTTYENVAGFVRTNFTSIYPSSSNSVTLANTMTSVFKKNGSNNYAWNNPSTIPVGRIINDFLFQANGFISNESSLFLSTGWTSIANVLVANTPGVTKPNVSGEHTGIFQIIGNLRTTNNIIPTSTITSNSTANQYGSNSISALLPFASPSVTGTVYRDNNGITDGINGGGTGGGTWNSANTLYVNAIDTNGNVVATTSVDASGIFNFPEGGGLMEDDVINFQLSRNQGIVGQSAPVKVLPFGWSNVGESTVSGASDGTLNGEFSLTIGAANSPNNTTNRFGVTQTSGIAFCPTGNVGNRILFGFFGDTNVPSGATRPHLIPSSNGSSVSSFITASNMTASSNVTLTSAVVGTTSTIRVGNVNTNNTTPVDFTAFNDYIYTTWTLAANSPIIRLDASSINRVSGGQGANFRARITVFDVASGTETIVLSEALFNSNSGTAYDLSAYNLLPGKIYQIRIYLSKAGATGSNPVTLDIDNPIFFGVPIANNIEPILYIPCAETTIPISTLNSNVSSQTPTNYELRWFDDNNVNVTSLVNVPIGTYTAYYFNTTNGCYQPASAPVNVVLGYRTLDSDGDGIPDDCDLDDDNDGILDTAELCKSQIYIDFFAGQSSTTNTVNSTTVVPTTASLSPAISRYSIGWHFGDATNAINQEMSINFSNPVYLAEDGIDFSLGGMDNGSKFGNFFIVYEDGIRLSNLDFSLANISGIITTSTINGAKAINSGASTNSSADLTLNGVNRTKRIVRIGYTVHALTGNAGTSENIRPRIQIDCDMDGDGIPNQLDLDSDGDGCPDAVEGGAAFTNSDLVNSSIPGGNSGPGYTGTSTSPIIQNLGNTVGDTVTTMGVPTVAGTGQTIGDSQNGSISSQCSSACYKPAILDAGNTYPTKHGITALGRAGAENENWPMTRQSAWTVLESKEKGFVVNRVATTDDLANITNPIEGMMVYDEEVDCLKIFTLKSGGTAMAWHCFVTPACPD